MIQIEWIYKDALRFNTLLLQHRNNEILHNLNIVYSRDPDTPTFGKLSVNGWKVCHDCYRSIYNISPCTWQRRQKDVREGKHNWEHGNVGHEGHYTQSGYLSRAWMSKFFCSLGDYQPDTGEIHLPPMAQQDVYDEMVVDLGDLAISKTHFYNVWQTEYPDVKIPPEQRIGKCAECADIHEKIMDSKDPREIAFQRRKRVEHIRFVRRERLIYHQWRQTCRDHPEKYMLVILDGMDQSKTNVPSFNCGENPFQMGVRIIGAIVHSATKRTYAYMVTHFTKETNTMVEVLGRVLADQDSLPPVLVIQLDNTSQDNKNSRLFTYLASLVETGQFDEIIVNFLPVGHTHVRNIFPLSKPYV